MENCKMCWRALPTDDAELNAYGFCDVDCENDWTLLIMKVAGIIQ